MSELLHLLIVVIVLCVFVWIANAAPFPAAYAPVRWVLYLIIAIIALYVLLPFLGISIGHLS